jgi:hypothetical protein
MSTPQLNDFQEAVQNPQSAFQDPALRRGLVKSNAIGPVGLSGNLAIVYQVQDGQQTWAVRCFHRPAPEAEFRLRAISAYLKDHPSPYFVAFEFQSSGIRVKGIGHPVVKMEWVRGQSLGTFLELNYKDSSRMLALAKKWVDMLTALAHLGVAHGDLQHGNVMVTDADQLKLIDYDGMYVPTLAGLPSQELGHANYTHPGRLPIHFGPYLDRFPGWVILVGLVAVAIDPSLWDRLRRGADDQLLLGKKDLLQPNTSAAIRALREHPDPRIQALAMSICRFLPLYPSQVEAVEGTLVQSIFRPAPKNSPQQQLPSRPPSTISGSADWIFDFLQDSVPTQPIALKADVLLERLILLVSACLLGAAFPLMDSFGYGLLGIGPGLAVVGAGFANLRFRGLPRVGERLKLRGQMGELSKQIGAVETEAGASVQAREAVLKQEQSHRFDFERQKKSFDETVNKEALKARQDADRALEGVLIQIEGLKKRQRDELTKLATNMQARNGKISHDLNSLAIRERQKREQSLTTLREQHIDRALRAARIVDQKIDLIGPKLTERLTDAGLETAADVLRGFPVIEQFNAGRRQSVERWAQGVRHTALNSAPTALSLVDENAIRKAFESERGRLLAEQSQVVGELQRGERDVNAMHTRDVAPLESRASLSRQSASECERLVRENFAPQARALAMARSKNVLWAQQELESIERKSAEIQAKAQPLHWERERLRRKLMVYGNITFENYLRLVIGFDAVPPSSKNVQSPKSVLKMAAFGALFLVLGGVLLHLLSPSPIDRAALPTQGQPISRPSVFGLGDAGARMGSSLFPTTGSVEGRMLGAQAGAQIAIPQDLH